MPHHSRSVTADEVPPVTSYGQVIEYIQGTSPNIYSDDNAISRNPPAPIADSHINHYADRLYLASYTHPPDENTPFPYPSKPSKSPQKRSRAQTGPQAAPNSRLLPPPFYFSIDRSLLYNAFHADFGPLHVGHLYRFAVQLHDVLGHPDNENRPVVFWSGADSRSESAFGCYGDDVHLLEC